MEKQPTDYVNFLTALLLNRKTDLKKTEEAKNYIATLKKKKGRDAESATKNKFVFE